MGEESMTGAVSGVQIPQAGTTDTPILKFNNSDNQVATFSNGTEALAGNVDAGTLLFEGLAEKIGADASALKDILETKGLGTKFNMEDSSLSNAFANADATFLEGNGIWQKIVNFFTGGKIAGEEQFMGAGAQDDATPVQTTAEM